MLYTGIRISECAALNLEDVYGQGRRNRIIIRNGKGGLYLEVPLNGEACETIQTWLQVRAKIYDGKETDPALFINQQGRRISTSALDLIICKVGQDAGVELSVHVLRHTLLKSLVRNGNDLVLVAEVGGSSALRRIGDIPYPPVVTKKRRWRNSL